MMAPEVLIKAAATVGEGPVVDPRTGRLCWVDIVGGWVYQNDLGSGDQTAHHFDTMVGAIAPRAAEAGFAAAVSDGFALIRDGEPTIIDPVLSDPDYRMNDAKCDSAGRLWAGSTHLEFEPGRGRLHRWDGSSPSSVLASGFTLPNGIGWSPDDRTMYLADSFAHVLLRADFDADDGVVGEFSTLCEIDGLPDGLAVDADGCLWLAVWGESQVRRIRPDGTLASVVEMPVSKPSSCAFGNDGTLYITSARADLTDEELIAQPLAGSVFAMATDTSGVPVAPFRG